MRLRAVISGCALLLSLSFLLHASRAFPLCTDARPPAVLNTTLKFCASYTGGTTSCCDADVDATLSKQFDAMNVSNSACAAVLKAVLCAKCSPYSADLFNTAPKIRTIPFLCNSTASTTSAQSKHTTEDYCKQVWETCKDVKIMNSPFQPPLQGSATLPSSSSKLTDAWQSENDFCASFGGAPDGQSVCLNGSTVSFNATKPSPPPKGICLERIDNGSYLNMAPHPDGSNRIFLGTQPGKIWLAAVPEQGSGRALQFEEAIPFVDLTDQVHFDSGFGLMGMAFHPDFATNGRFFASYNCDRTKSPSCTGRCSCNSDVDCDPSKLGTENGAQPCQYQAVISEYSAKGSSSNISEVTSADPSEVRRIFTMGLPFTSQHGGQNIGSASIMGGYVYRGSTDPCLYGRYLYADLYASAMWTGTESPENSGNYTSTQMSFSCSKDSPIPCETAAGSPLPSLGYIYSFGEDNNKDIYVLASKGVYRVVRPSLCDYTCPTEKAVAPPAGASSKAPTMAMGTGKQMRALLLLLFLCFGFW
ncbi:hypothetical protein PR202_ga11723 [Eleusine coracana subsp. coracana]|uniref:HIPL1 protein n=1 Tax=Eleusine coracana subsp. coracana TaxID=191504 RepID=A0AAV5CAB0_ELECO|nr:hypothetical protein PR202_ga11723 [Eleusine coracana subsp. coracana]